MLDIYRDFAEKTAKEAGIITLKYFSSDFLNTKIKDDNTPVTIADKEAEKFIRKQIKTNFPSHSIVGEEFGEEENKGTSKYRWIIDPIDGTKSFIRGVPLYAVLIALEIDNKVEVGCSYFPALDEIVSAHTDGGSFWNGKKCEVSKISDINKAICSHMDVNYFYKNNKGDKWMNLQKSVYYNAGWCDAYGYLLVATGRVEIMIDPVINIWDCAPFSVILKEAGGYFGNWSGKEGDIYSNESLATNGLLKDKVISILNKK